MIICINYSADGERHIILIDYSASRHNKHNIALAKAYAKQYDEVYVIDFKENKEFVDEVVLRGCRV